MIPKEILNHYAIKPRKRFGQSFLIDQNSIERIARIAAVERQDIVVEIGAGIGVLTELLAQNSNRVIAVELDHQLVEVLKDRLSKYQNVEIHHVNILRFDFRKMSGLGNQKIKVVGNIPYNISSPLLFYLLSFKDIINSFTLMMQKELVERLVASPGNKTYGVPSVLLQMFATVEKVIDVPAGFFYPVPKVESSVMKGIFNERPKIPLNDEDYFTAVVRNSFAQRRKMIFNNLKRSKLMNNLEESVLKESLSLASIEGQRRAETLTVEEFGNLSNILWDKARSQFENGL
jgi:16S rRNA (adenine1518-N6/adenine1519-N6)-dimethyltransferase